MAARAKALHPTGRPVAQQRPHLTLSFLGRVDDERIDALVVQTGNVEAEAFSVTLDRQGGFCCTGIGWLAPAAASGPASADCYTG